MNLTHLGDALDHWKGSVIRLLRSEIPDLRVIPMLTDPNDWNFDLFSVYAGLLGVAPEAILKQDTKILPTNERVEYFSVDSRCDLFIDPDNGVGNEKETPSRKHIMPSEIARLVPTGSTRLVLIYQTANRGDKRSHIKEKVKILKTAVGQQRVFAYFAGQVSMIFVSRDAARLSRLREHLQRLLGPVARDDGVPGRIIG